MLIPSEKLRSALLQMSFGLFWETVEPENAIALVCKLPSEIIKYISLGVPIYLSTGFIPIRDGLAMCSIFSVEDDPEAMFFIQRTHDPLDTSVLARFYEQSEADLHAFDELNRNIASFKCKISASPSKADQLRRITPLVRELSDNERLDIFRQIEYALAQDATKAKESNCSAITKL